MYTTNKQINKQNQINSGDSPCPSVDEWMYKMCCTKQWAIIHPQKCVAHAIGCRI